MCAHIHVCVYTYMTFFLKHLQISFTCLNPLFLNIWCVSLKTRYILLHSHRKVTKLNKFNMDIMFLPNLAFIFKFVSSVIFFVAFIFSQDPVQVLHLVVISV